MVGYYKQNGGETRFPVCALSEVKGVIKTMNNAMIELSNVEIYEHCMLNVRTGEKEYNKGKKRMPYYMGEYFRDENTFFALYPVGNGLIMYYEGKEYPLRKDLHISLEKKGKLREFRIEEYKICINYHASPYIGFDVWSEEKDVDLFYRIEQSYKDDDFYKKYTE